MADATETDTFASRTAYLSTYFTGVADQLRGAAVCDWAVPLPQQTQVDIPSDIESNFSLDGEALKYSKALTDGSSADQAMNARSRADILLAIRGATQLRYGTRVRRLLRASSSHEALSDWFTEVLPLVETTR